MSTGKVFIELEISSLSECVGEYPVCYSTT